MKKPPLGRRRGRDDGEPGRRLDAGDPLVAVVVGEHGDVAREAAEELGAGLSADLVLRRDGEVVVLPSSVIPSDTSKTAASLPLLRNFSNDRLDLAAMSPPKNGRGKRKRGPRGGKTTISKDGAMVRKAVYLDWAIVDAIRGDARRKHLLDSQVLRQALREYYNLE